MATRPTHRSLPAVIAGTAMLMLVLAGLLFQFDSELIGMTVFAFGGSTECTWTGAAAGERTFSQQQELTGALEKSASLLKKADGLELWQTKMGRFWIPEGASGVLFSDLAEQGRGIYSLPGHEMRTGDVVLDCGANVGVFTRQALAAGASKVIAIEPVPDNLNSLRRNFSNEIEQGRVVVVPKGVWDQDDVLEIFIESKNMAAHSFVVDRSKQGIKVPLPLTTIDRIVDELKLGRVDFVKMDIEGAERRALDGARKTLARHHPRMALCVYHLPDDPAVIPVRVAAAWPGYSRSCGPCIPSRGRMLPEVYFFK